MQHLYPILPTREKGKEMKRQSQGERKIQKQSLKVKSKKKAKYVIKGYGATTVFTNHEINIPRNSIIDSHHLHGIEQYQTFGSNFETLYLKRKGYLT